MYVEFTAMNSFASPQVQYGVHCADFHRTENYLNHHGSFLYQIQVEL
jgi:hypothetical protein